MNSVFAPSLSGVRRRPVAAGVISIFALSSPLPAFAATTWVVNSCDGVDAVTPTTLRYAAANAVDGDTIDLTGLKGVNACPSSKISLTTGEIVVHSVTINGPGASILTIDGTGNPGGATGSANSRVFTHMAASVSGTLKVQYLGIRGGHSVQKALLAQGGCIYSQGTVTLNFSYVSGCYANNYGTNRAYGGAIYTKGGLNLKYSTVVGNDATGAGDQGVGGAAFVRGSFFAKYSTVSTNTASSRAGGIYVNGNTTLAATTVSKNQATSYAGIDAFSESPAGNTFAMGNSTLSGNVATYNTGALYVNSGTTNFYNSTIAFNSAGNAIPGVFISSPVYAIAVQLQSTLMSNNSYAGGGDNDLVADGSVTFNNGDLITAANNLIRVASMSTSNLLPDDTKFGTCPFLGPLNNNGGLTKTHALGSSSFAIDHGNLVGGGNFDQRGSAAANGTRDYITPSGPIGDLNPQPDIGSYEVQQDDVIFYTPFDGCVFN